MISIQFFPELVLRPFTAMVPPFSGLPGKPGHEDLDLSSETVHTSKATPINNEDARGVPSAT
jgi:hypothetical protein